MKIHVTKPGLILLDFDHTVFDTSAYVARAQQYFAERFGISVEDFNRQRDAVKDCCVVIDIDTFVAKLPHDDKDGMHEAMLQLIRDSAGEFTYPDALPFVERHVDTFDIVLLTHGDTELQTAKIEASGLAGRVQYAITTEQKSEAIAPYVKKYQSVHFVDDKPRNITDVKVALPAVQVYYMRRPDDHPYGEKEPECACEHKEVTGLDFTIAADS